MRTNETEESLAEEQERRLMPQLVELAGELMVERFLQKRTLSPGRDAERVAACMWSGIKQLLAEDRQMLAKQFKAIRKQQVQVERLRKRSGEVGGEPDPAGIR